MKAVAVYPGRRAIEITEQDQPPLIRDTDIGVRILEVGVCGTDREIADFQYGTPPSGIDHLVIGHEALARVVEVGSKVEQLRPGQLIVPMVRRPCPQPECIACRSGHQDFCFTGEFTERGIKGAHGYMTEFAVDDDSFACPVPEELRHVAVLVEPLTIAEKALFQLQKLVDRLPWAQLTRDPQDLGRHRAAVVIGAGPVGLLGAMLLTMSGFRTYVYSRSPAPNPRANLVDLIDATYISSSECSADDLAGQVGRIDVIYEAAADPKTALKVLGVLGANGVMVITGVSAPRLFELDAGSMLRTLVLKNQVLVGTVNADRRSFDAAIRHLAAFHDRWPTALTRLITNRFPLEASPEVLTRRLGGIKNVVVVNETELEGGPNQSSFQSMGSGDQS